MIKISKVTPKMLGICRVFNNSLIPDEEVLSVLKSGFDDEFFVDSEKDENEKLLIVDGSELIYDKYSISYENESIKIKGSFASLPAALNEFISSDLPIKELNGSIGKKTIYSKETLMTLLERVYSDKDRSIFGRQVQGSDVDCISAYINGFYKSSGKYPGIIGVDLACYGIDVMNRSDVDLSRFICDIVEYCSDGGILTLSSHFDNPSGNNINVDRCRGLLGFDESLEAYEKAFCDLITEGTELNTVFMKELRLEARFLKMLEENGVPIIWRPLHEMNGGWFWYCVKQWPHILDAKYIIDLWKYIYRYLTDEWELKNLIWNYSPNYNNQHSVETTYLYPGDEYCDMVGVDWYTTGKLELVNDESYLELLKMSGKISALNENGPSPSILDENFSSKNTYNCQDYYNDLIKLKELGYSFTYVLHWFGIVLMGDTRDFMHSDIAMGLDEVKKLFSEIEGAK